MTNEIVFDNVSDFDPDHIFDCGQAFRWRRTGEGCHVGVAGHRAAEISFSPIDGNPHSGTVKVKPVGAVAHARPCPPKERDFWKSYLDLDRDYGIIKSGLSSHDAVMHDATRFGGGIRILRQDSWEALVSFIISQNNHIPRIKGCIENLCGEFGEPVGMDGETAFFSFPEPETLAGLEAGDLAACRLGYRAGYIVRAAKQVLESGGREYLESLRDVSYEAAEGALREIRGVGPKVAACVLLFGLGHVGAFPVDVWISRVMEESYGIGIGDRRAVAAYAAEHFGDWAGIAQQYLFYHRREKAK